ncbi:MAG: acetyl-CoA carboxylase biotin carboxyl carrier protein subunit [Reyranella sp.]
MNSMGERIETQVPGNIWKVLVKPGDAVKAGDTLFIMEVMKTEVPHDASVDGTVAEVRIAEGEEGLEAGILAIVIT